MKALEFLDYYKWKSENKRGGETTAAQCLNPAILALPD